MKKFISMMMALAMTFALAIPAFATSQVISGSGWNSAGYSFDLDPETKTPTVNVYVPAPTGSDKLILNPYGLKFQVDQKDFTDQIVSTPIWLGSYSNVALRVGMKVTATTAGNATLSAKSLAEDTKTKTNSVFIWGQALPAGKSADKPATLPTFSTSYDASETSMILVKSGESSKDVICTIPACAQLQSTADNEWACVKFFGDAVKAPTTPWADTDTVTLNITFTFTPSMEDAG